MSIFNEDRSTFNQTAAKFDSELSNACFDFALLQAHESGMNLDEIMYVTLSHTERVLRRAIVQDQLKKVANKDR